MIDENKLIEVIRNMVLPLTIPEIDDGTTLAYNEALVDVLNAIEEQPRAGKWIPVEEGLPKNNDYVLVTCENGEIDSAFCQKGIWFLTYIDDDVYPVIAWMPLPEPYVEGEEKNERL